MRQYYFVSLAAYGHRVFKCNGFGAEDPKHLAFYKPHFERWGGESRDKRKESQGPFKVIIVDQEKMPQRANDFMTEDGQFISFNEAQRFLKLS